jgi:predicted nucleic acid-binding protein
MSGRTFVDSNVLIYAYQSGEGRKYRIANSALRELWEQQSGALSMQVLQEFYVNITRKVVIPVPKNVARRVVENYSLWCVETTPSEIATAFRIEDEARIGFWDALIVAAAVKGGADRILSEDLNPRQRVAGVLIENPFL